MALGARVTESRCLAQCLDWTPGFESRGVSFDVEALAVYDAGGGPAVCAGGSFPITAPESAKRIARWDGTRWSPLAPATNGAVLALRVFDLGAGPRLIAGGGFTQAGSTVANFIASFDGAAWAALGSGFANPSEPSDGKVTDLAVFDDGTGAALYAAGAFTTSGATSVRRIARWNGVAWSALANGFNATVRALAVHDDGSGPALYAGGAFTSASGVTANRVARWNGTSWSALSTGMNGEVFTLCVHDDGSGPALYAGGSFSLAGGATAASIAKWQGGAWSPVGGGADGLVRKLVVCETGAGAALFAAGEFANAGGLSASRVARWTGMAWTPLSSGTDARTSALLCVDEGAQHTLFAGGAFTRAGDVVASRVARWTGADWTALGNGRGANETVWALATYDSGSGPVLIAGGDFTIAGGVRAARVARFDGTAWQPLGEGMDLGVQALLATPLRAPGGPVLYAAGNFMRAGTVPANFIAQWQAGAWMPVGGGANGAVRALATFDDGTGGGPALYAAGTFSVAGGTSAILIAKWDGVNWSALGEGLGIPHFNSVFALTAYQRRSSSSAVLVAGGSFLTAGGIPASRVASWDGTAWSSLSAGTNGTVSALTVFDAGEGAELYAGGTFSKAGGAPANNVARWDGFAWYPLASGLNGSVSALGVFDDGGGRRLYAGGVFALDGESELANLARWDGVQWTRVTSVIDSAVRSLQSYNDGSATGPDLCVGGSFTSAGGVPADRIAAWRGCGAPGVASCFGDGLDSALMVGCPCGNLGERYHGCANSDATLGGAQLGAVGDAHATRVLLTCRGLPEASAATFLSSPAGISGGKVFGDGILCVGANPTRFGLQVTGESGGPPHVASASAPRGASGRTLYYQCQYRNPVPTFCRPAMLNLSNAYEIHW